MTRIPIYLLLVLAAMLIFLVSPSLYGYPSIRTFQGSRRPRTKDRGVLHSFFSSSSNGRAICLGVDVSSSRIRNKAFTPRS